MSEDAGTAVPNCPALRISARSFDKLAGFITGEVGIQLPPSKQSMIQSRLLRRVRELGLGSIDEYCEHVFSPDGPEEERVHLIDAITTNKTDFFREPQHFKYLTGTILAQFERSRHSRPDRPFAVWSAPCSSGEEPYTLAMLLSEYAAARPQFDFRILATDVSTKVLQLAKDGIYTKPQIEPVPPELRRKYLLHGKGEQSSLVRVTPALRQRVSFYHLNLMEPNYGVREHFDVIFCRNLLIYFDGPTQEAVINKLCRNLIPGGYLFISHSESLSGLNVPVVSVSPACYRKQGA